jgi:two-component system chemotaxis sensor kinase CheA
MDRHKLIEQLMATFLAELEEHVTTLNRGVLALEQGVSGENRAETLRVLFRAAHSLKGASRAVSLGLIESACHRLEEILKGLAEDTVAAGPDLYQMLFASADALADAGSRVRERLPLAGSPLEALLPVLDAARGPGVQGSYAPPGLTATRLEELVARGTLARPASTLSPATLSPAEPDALVRVPASRVDDLLQKSGELLVTRRRLGTHVERVRALGEAVQRLTARWIRVGKPLSRLVAQAGASQFLAQAVSQTGDELRRLNAQIDRLALDVRRDQLALDRAAGEVEEEAFRFAMLPFAQVAEGLHRAVRDFARSAGREVDLVVEGGEVEIDRSVLDGLRDPLLHLVSNAVDHGIEMPAERAATGKPQRARITASVVLRGSEVEITVADDGRGLDLEAIAAAAKERGVPVSPDDLESLVFVQGLSTSRTLTSASGRGIGLDVVKNRVEALHGRVRAASVQGKGARFILTLPLTLSRIRALLVEAGGRRFALGAGNVRQFLRVAPEDLQPVEGRETVRLGDRHIAVVAMTRALGLGSDQPPAATKLLLAVVSDGIEEVALAVDEVVSEQEIIVKPFAGRAAGTGLVSAASILADGSVALILNAADLVRAALGLPPRPLVEHSGRKGDPRRVLLVEDSMTTLLLERGILEAAGYDVVPATDGQQAWDVLQSKGADIVVSDIEMPGIDGFALTAAVRASARFRDLPVILVTSRETAEDKARGLDAGADAYIVKSAFDQRELLETIAQLL